jgi:methionyl-tRNA formyltransferase
MRCLFIGTGEIGVPALRWLAQSPGHDVVGVVCQPDRPVGRHHRLVAPPTKVVAAEEDVRLWQPEKIIEAAGELQGAKPDVTIVMAYGQFLPRSIRQLSKLACINLHASLLPRWRGASPVQAAIAAGDAITGITAMHVEAEMDAGDMILAETTPIRPTDTGQTLHERLSLLAPRAIERALPLIEAGTAPRVPQDITQVTHCGRLDRHHGVIDWMRPAEEIERLVRAYHPWPGTSTCLPGGGRLKIFPPAEVIKDEAGEAGMVAGAGRRGLFIGTGNGVLRVENVQPEGKRRMTAAEFLAGHRLERGMRLGNEV